MQHTREAQPAPTVFHRSFAGGRFAYVVRGGDTFKVVETGTGVVFVELCDRAGMPRKDVPAWHADTVDAAIVELGSGPAVNAWEHKRGAR